MICVLFLLVSCASQKVVKDTRYDSVLLQNSEVIVVGDSISFSIWGYPEFTTQSVVRQSGSITIPLLREMGIVGFTAEEFKNLLRQKLAELVKGEIRITLEILSPTARIIVVGTVGRQASITSNTALPLLEVISNAGGWTDESDLRQVTISRSSSGSDEKTIININLQNLLESGDMHSLPMVRPGDVIFVPKKENVVREVAEYLRDAFLLFGFFRLFN